MNVNKLIQMPQVFIYPTMRCNIQCSYCCIGEQFRDQAKLDKYEGFLNDPFFRETIKNSEPISFVITGGEPTIAPGLVEFIREFGKYGHRFSFNTNFYSPMRKIEEIFTAGPIEYYGIVKVSHHFLYGLSIEELLHRCNSLRDMGINPYILYVMVPNELSRIKEYTSKLNDDGFAVQTNPLMGFNLGRKERFPGAYTVDECLEIFNMATGKVDATIIFGGVYSLGKPCRGGQDLIDWNFWFTEDSEKGAPCCNGYSKPIDLRDTFLFTGKQGLKPCNMEYCGGATLLSNRFGNREYDDGYFQRLVDGTARPVGPEASIETVCRIIDDGYKLVNQEKFLEVKAAYEKRKTMKVQTV